MAGYAVFFEYFIVQSDRQLLQQLDNDQFNDTELIEVKLPLHLPYMIIRADYERIDGEIELNGNYYNYVKRKVSNDTLYLQCVPNTAKTKLNEARNVYGQQAGDNTAREKFPTIKEYDQPIAQFNFTVPTLLNKCGICCRCFHLMDPLIDDTYHPPQVHC